jgi:hypothetical protein
MTYEPSPPKLIVTNNLVTQGDRKLPALAPGYAPVEGRGLAEHLAMGPAFGSLFTYYDAGNQAAGDWSRFFAQSPAVLCASILALDSADVLDVLDAQDTDAQDTAAKAALVTRTARLIGDVATQSRLWTGASSNDPADAEPSDLRHLAQQAVAGVAASPDDLDDMTGNALAVAEALCDLQAVARDHLTSEMGRNDHAPQLGLFMALCETLRHASATINRFSQRLVAFYDHEVLRASPAPDRADAVFLAVEVQNEDGAFLPEGTLFPAGVGPDDRDIVFAATQALQADAVEIVQVRTVRQVQAPLVLRGATAPDAQTAFHHHHHHHDHHHHHHGHHHHHHHPPDPPRSDLPVPAFLLQAEISLPFPTDITPDTPAFATFGPETPVSDDVQTAQLAQIGFCISTQTLALASGARCITVTLTLEGQDSVGNLIDMLDTGLSMPQRHPAQRRVAALTSILRQAFDIALHTDDGWLSVPLPEDSVALDWDGDDAGPFTATYKLNLPSDFPSVAGQIRDDDGVLPDPTVPEAPSLKFTVVSHRVPVFENDDAWVYPYAFTSLFALGKIDLKVCVTDGLITAASNTDGDLDLTVPFAFFGGAPNPGAYFDVRSEELFSKQVSWLDVTVSWFNLPLDDTGFQGYFANYTLNGDGTALLPPVTNATFQARWDMVGSGWWRVQPKPGPVYRTRAPGTEHDDKILCDPGPPTAAAPLCPRSIFDDFTIEPCTAPPYFDPADSFLRFSLTAPAYGFGAPIYAINVLNSVVKELEAEDDPLKIEAECALYCNAWKALSDAVRASVDSCDGTSGHACYDYLLPGMLLISVEFWEAATTGDGADDVRAVLTDSGANMPEFLNWIANNEAIAPEASLKDLQARLSERMDMARPESSVRWCFLVALMELWIAIFRLRAMAEVNAGVLDRSFAAFFVMMADGFERCVNTCIVARAQSVVDPDKGLDVALISLPNEPYLPQASAVRVSYCASISSLAEAGAPDDLVFWHLGPFADLSAQPVLSRLPVWLLPQVGGEGALWIGMRGAAHSVSLLFDMGMAPPGAQALGLPALEWSARMDSGWVVLPPADLRLDTTEGLNGTGIVRLNLPSLHTQSDVAADDAPVFWLRASTPAVPLRFPATLAITPNAVHATRVRGADLAPFTAPLLAGSITATMTPIAGVAAIVQPGASFGGRKAQGGGAFRVTTAERLRHKDRAALNWDYERLVLEEFPDIWGVHVLPAHDAWYLRPGATLVVVVPGPDSPQVKNSLMPTIPGPRLREIATALSRRASAFAAISVVNPAYLPIRVCTTVAFAEGVGAGTGIDLLNADLCAYLSPWGSDTTPRVRDVGYWNQSAIAAFILSRVYVTEVVRLSCQFDCAGWQGNDWCFFTSAPGHDISVPGTGSGA